ncbi:MAG: DUF2147 domain-containing protein [Bacteroidota bacterium]
MNILTRFVLLAVACVFLGSTAFAQSPIGMWRTIDDETGEPKSLVEIYEQDGELYGKIAKLLPDDGSIPEVCEICEGEYHNKPLVGVVIIKGMEQDGDEWEDGTITDPANGKTYSAKMSLSDANTLEVRGFIKVPLMGSALGRTQTWYRVAE